MTQEKLPHRKELCLQSDLSSLKELKLGTQKELKFLSSFLSCYFPKTFGYLEISYLKCYIES